MGQVREQVLPKFASYNLRAIVSPVAAISGGGGRFNADISFMLRGPNLEKLNEYSQHLLNKLKAMPGVVDADTSLIVGKPELRAAIDRQKACRPRRQRSRCRAELCGCWSAAIRSRPTTRAASSTKFTSARARDFRTDAERHQQVERAVDAARQHRPRQYRQARRRRPGRRRSNAVGRQRQVHADGEPQARLLAERRRSSNSTRRSKR